MTDLEQFNQLFEELPQIAILYIFNNDELNLKSVLEDIASKHSGSLKQIDINSGCEFKQKGRDFEYIITYDIFDRCCDIEKVLKRLYYFLENSAFLIIIEKDLTKKELFLNLLERNNFLASNDIDIFDNHLLIMSKKMHMWDGGI